MTFGAWFDHSVIYTYADGTPIEGRPEPLPADHVYYAARRERGMSYAEARPYLDAEIDLERAWHRYQDRVADVSLKAFSQELKLQQFEHARHYP